LQLDIERPLSRGSLELPAPNAMDEFDPCFPLEKKKRTVQILGVSKSN
jgi:hypothetical protein